MILADVKEGDREVYPVDFSEGSEYEVTLPPGWVIRSGADITGPYLELVANGGRILMYPYILYSDKSPDVWKNTFLALARYWATEYDAAQHQKVLNFLNHPDTEAVLDPNRGEYRASNPTLGIRVQCPIRTTYQPLMMLRHMDLSGVPF